MCACFELQPLALDDAACRDRYRAATNRIWPEFAQTDAEFLHEAARSGPNERWLVVDTASGRDVGVAQVERIRWNEPTAPPLAFLLLDEDQRTAAAYRELLAPCAAFSRELGETTLRVLAWDRETVLLDLLQRELGWEEVSRDVDVQIDVTRTDIPWRDLPDGIEVVTRAERPEIARSAWEALAASLRDIPSDEPVAIPTFEEWVEERADESHADEALFAAVIDGRVAGYAELELPALLRAQGIGWHGYTAVHPDFRGRGLSVLLKQATIEWARANDIRYLRTENEERNAPIRHVNAKLGYEPAGIRMILRGPATVD